MTARDIAAEFAVIAARLDAAIFDALADHPDAETLLRKYRNRQGLRPRITDLSRILVGKPKGAETSFRCGSPVTE
jgi:hypothetical protein